jgi:putative transposase
VNGLGNPKLAGVLQDLMLRAKRDHECRLWSAFIRSWKSMPKQSRCGSRRLIHCNITAHPSATWTLQQLRVAIGFQDRYEYLLHDRDCIFAKHLDESIAMLGVRVLKSPPRSPTANAICERVIGTIRRECLDWLIPLSETHLRSILKSWIPHYNRARPHMALGPGVPDPPTATHRNFNSGSRHRLRECPFRGHG